MNTPLKKVVPVFLAVVAVLSVATAQVFASNPAENRGIAHERATQTAQREDRPQTQNQTETGEDFSFSGVIEAIGANSYTIGGQTVAVNASTLLDSGLALGVTAKVEVIRQADGTLLAKEIETDADDSPENETEHRSGDDHGSDDDLIDDHGGNSGKIDDHGSSGSEIEDHGSDSDSDKDDDHGSDSGKDDDHGSDSGKVDDHGSNSGKNRNP